MPLDCGTQVVPPSVVRRIVPTNPTAVPVFASLKNTSKRSRLVPLDWLCQVVPPSVDLENAIAEPDAASVASCQTA